MEDAIAHLIEILFRLVVPETQRFEACRIGAHGLLVSAMGFRRFARRPQRFCPSLVISKDLASQAQEIVRTAKRQIVGFPKPVLTLPRKGGDRGTLQAAR